jgi:hypothetical protein
MHFTGLQLGFVAKRVGRSNVCFLPQKKPPEAFAIIKRFASNKYLNKCGTKLAAVKALWLRPRRFV